MPAFQVVGRAAQALAQGVSLRAIAAGSAAFQ